MKTWVNRIAVGTGKPPIIYTAKYFWDDDVATTELGDLPLWVADYGVACPDLPEAWGTWKFWQFGYRSDVEGLSGDVDVDWFNGSMDALRVFARGSFAVSPFEAGAGVDAQVAHGDAGNVSSDSDALAPVSTGGDAGGVLPRTCEAGTPPLAPNSRARGAHADSAGCPGREGPTRPIRDLVLVRICGVPWPQTPRRHSNIRNDVSTPEPSASATSVESLARGDRQR